MLSLNQDRRDARSCPIDPAVCDRQTQEDPAHEEARRGLCSGFGFVECLSKHFPFSLGKMIDNRRENY